MVIGDLIIDKYMWGEVNRISPEAPVPVVDIEEETTRLGGAANVVQNLSTLGITPILLSVIGKDNNGNKLLGMLQEVNCSNRFLLKSSERITTIKTRIMAKHQQIVRADYESNKDLSSQELQSLLALFQEAVQNIDGIIISDYGKGVICTSLLKEIISICHRNNIFIAIDPKDRHFEMYKRVSIITPNLKEAHGALGIPYSSHLSDDEIKDLGWKITNNFKISYLLLTLSERGIALFERSKNRYFHLPTVAQKVYDVTGAGDTVISVFTAAITNGATPLEAAYLANNAAGITVAELGTASVTMDTLKNACIE